MTDIEKIKDKFIDIYCRLEYDIWYQGYKDDVSQLLKETPLYSALTMVAKSNPQNKIIKVSGEHCNTNEELKRYINLIMYFLEDYTDYKVIFALPYEKQKLADSIAYNRVKKEINDNIIINEMKEEGYVIQIQNRWYFEDILFINLYSDKTVKYGKSLDKGLKIVKGQFKIDDSLYTKVYNWAKKYVDKNKINGMVMGEVLPRDYKFQVSFSSKVFGINELNEYLDEYRANKIEGHGALTELLQLPELKVLFEESDDDL